MHAEVTNYILPQYRNKDGQLQFVIYGDRAMNKGAMVNLRNVFIDVLQDDIRTLEKANIFIPVRGERIPPMYPLTAGEAERKTFWKQPKMKTVRAWIHAQNAAFDKNSNILRSDDRASFRSREMDVDGIGFDAYSDRKFIRIRSRVRVVIRPEIRNNINAESKSADKNTQEK